MTALSTREALAKADEAIAAWEQRGPTSLTVALLAEAVYGLRGAVVDAETRALREAADAVENECSHSSEACFCTSADWLRRRATALTERGQA